MSSLEERHGKLAQLHPEDLLDKAARGDLSDDERERLEAHLAKCPACRMEQLLRADFESDEDGDRISYTSLVEGALGAVAADRAPAAAPPAKDEPVAPPPPAPREDERVVAIAPAPWKRFALLFAAAFVLLATAAAASESGRAMARKATSMFGADRTPREKAPEPVEAKSVPATVVAPIVPTVATTAEAPVPVAAPPVLAAAPSPEAHPVSKPLVVAPVVAAEAPAAPASAPRDDAAALFSSANDKRRAGNLAGALEGYGELVARFPSSREASTAQALRGRILLEQRDARRALDAFDAYLATGRGELREEAMVGRARALGLLGRGDAELRAWQAFVAAFPASASAEHARLRIEALSSRPPG